MTSSNSYMDTVLTFKTDEIRRFLHFETDKNRRFLRLGTDKNRSKRQKKYKVFDQFWRISVIGFSENRRFLMFESDEILNTGRLCCSFYLSYLMFVLLYIITLKTELLSIPINPLFKINFKLESDSLQIKAHAQKKEIDQEL